MEATCVHLDEAERIKHLFQDHHLRHTRQRELVYASLRFVHSHPTAEDLYTMVRQHDQGVSLATIYNTLDALVECGLARKIPSHLGGGACRFDADLSAHVHVSGSCGSVRDVPQDLSDQLLASVSKEVLKEIEARLGVEVVGVSLQLIAR